jgi:glyoxylase-like metal-dependent hydrolase (beta-lactamase superfamily II)
MLTIGDFDVIRIEEGVFHQTKAIFRQWTDDVLNRHRDLLVPHFFEPGADAFRVSIHSYAIRSSEGVILIDTCAGNAKPRPLSPRFSHLDTPYLQRLRAAGITPDDVRTVICTHLHVDHIGWNTRLSGDRWVPTFPNARYLFSRVEVEARDPDGGAVGAPAEAQLPFRDSVAPILAAGQAQLVAGDERLDDAIDLVPIPGHAPGQFAVRLRQNGREVLFAADVMHLPIQVYYPEWNSMYCEIPELAAATRQKTLESCADRDCLVLPTHFCFPHGGRVVRSGEQFAFIPTSDDLTSPG